MNGYLKLNLHGANTQIEEGSDPEHQFNLRSGWDITEDLEFSAGLAYVDHLASLDVSSYFRADLGLTWRPTDDLEFSVWGQNLIDGEHLEFREEDSGSSPPSEVRRGIYAQVSYRF